MGEENAGNWDMFGKQEYQYGREAEEP